VADLAYRKANLEHAAASVTGLTQGTLLVSLLTIPLLAMAAPEITIFGFIRHRCSCHADRGVRHPDAAARVDHAALVWGYALVWFVVEDQVKLLAYRAFDRAKPALLARPAAA